MLIIPQAWVERYAPLPDDWWCDNAPALLRAAPNIDALVEEVAERVGIDPRLLVTRMQLEQSALTYAWNGSARDYPGGDADKLRYLCGVDRTDSGDRPGGWFGVEGQLLGCALRFKYWYRGEDSPLGANWLGLREDPRFAPGVTVTRDGVSITPANQASADCLRYTTSMPAQKRLRAIGMRYFPEDYAEEESVVVTIRQHTVAEFADYLRDWRERGAVLKATFLHHTYIPNASQYKGLSTIEGIRQAHLRRQPPFSDIACHAYTAPDGTVFNARPPSSNNCACQAPPDSKNFSDLPKTLRELILRDGISGWREWPNAYGFGCETIGNFDVEDPTQSVAMKTSLDVIAEVHRIWGIPVEHCFFHRDVSFKSCPGERVSRDWVHAELRKRLEGEPVSDTVKIILGTGPEPEAVIDANARVEDGTLRADVRPLLETLGYTIYPEHIKTQGKLYIEEANNE